MGRISVYQLEVQKNLIIQPNYQAMDHGPSTMDHRPSTILLTFALPEQRLLTLKLFYECSRFSNAQTG